MFITLSKIFQAIFRTSNMLLEILALGTLLLWTRWHVWGRRLVTLVTILFFTIAIFPVGEWLALPLERCFPIPASFPEKIDGIITTGGINPYATLTLGQPKLNDEAETLTAAVALARLHPEAKIVFTGGSGSLLYQEISEASAAALFFIEQGIASDRLILDSSSRGTQEKAVHCMELLKPQASATWVLVTSAMRMPRTWHAFAAAGWNIRAYPVGFHSPDAYFLKFALDNSLRVLWHAVKEWAGLFAYRLTGRTKALLPAPGSP
jgi:uncharacterized SAM-binding protein YcdF (DUF218 family)